MKNEPKVSLELIIKIVGLSTLKRPRSSSIGTSSVRELKPEES